MAATLAAGVVGGLLVGCSGGEEPVEVVTPTAADCQTVVDDALAMSLSSAPQFDAWEASADGQLLRCEFKPSSQWWFLHAEPHERGSGTPKEAESYLVAVVNGSGKDAFKASHIVEAGPNWVVEPPLSTRVDLTEEIALTSSVRVVAEALLNAATELEPVDVVKEATTNTDAFVSRFGSPSSLANDVVEVVSVDVVDEPPALNAGDDAGPRFKTCVRAGDSWALHDTVTGVLGSGTNTDPALECTPAPR